VIPVNQMPSLLVSCSCKRFVRLVALQQPAVAAVAHFQALPITELLTFSEGVLQQSQPYHCAAGLQHARVDNGGTANAGRVQSFQSLTIDSSDTFTTSVGFNHVQLGAAGTSISIPFTVGGITLTSVSVYTADVQNLDFTIANDSTCAAGTTSTTCTVDVTFSPTAAGLRTGELVYRTAAAA
jgi:hypothetical protein